MYRLMFGSTSAHGINAPAGNVLTLTVAEIEQQHPQLRACGARGAPVDPGGPDHRVFGR